MHPSDQFPGLTACQLAVDALGLAPIGEPWPEDRPATCALEGRPIRKGDLFARWKPGANFMDQHATIDSPYIGGAAAAMLAKTAMQKTQYAVFTRDGAFSLTKDSYRAWFFLTPPEPPFVAVLSTSTLQHLVWRTPICWSQDLITFRFGQDVLTVRRPRLHAALALLADHPDKARPFILLGRDEKKPVHGRFQAKTPPALRRELADLTRGELIALATLAKRNPPIPERSDPIILGGSPA